MFEKVIALLQLAWLVFAIIVIFTQNRNHRLRYTSSCGMVVVSAIDIARTAFHQDWGWLLFNIILLFLWWGSVKMEEKHLAESPSGD